MLLAIARFDAPRALASIGNGNQFVVGGIDLGQRRALGIGGVGERAVFVGEMRTATVQFKLFVRPKGCQFNRAHRQLEHARVKVFDEHAVRLVILRLQTERVRFDAKIDVLRDENRPLFRVRFLHGNGQLNDAAVHIVVAAGEVAVLVFVLENDAQPASVREGDPFAQTAFGAQTVERARNGARVRPALGGFAFEPVNFLDDLDGNQDVVLLKIEDRVRVVQKNVGVENVIFH